MVVLLTATMTTAGVLGVTEYVRHQDRANDQHAHTCQVLRSSGYWNDSTPPNC